MAYYISAVRDVDDNLVVVTVSRDGVLHRSTEIPAATAADTSLLNLALLDAGISHNYTRYSVRYGIYYAVLSNSRIRMNLVSPEG